MPLLALLTNKTALTIIGIFVAATAFFATIIYVADQLADARVAARERQIEQQNKEAHDDAVQARDLVGDCYRSGGMWSQTTGNCER